MAASDSYEWDNAGGGDFDVASNWNTTNDNGQKIHKVPDATAALLFDVGGDYTVSCGGETVGDVSVEDTDSVTFTGGLTSTLGFGATGSTLALDGGTYSGEGAVAADLKMSSAHYSSTGGGTSGGTLDITDSSVEDPLEISADIVSDIDDSALTTSFLLLSGKGTISESILHSTPGQYADDGDLVIDGDYTATDTTATAASLAGFLGDITYVGGSVRAAKIGVGSPLGDDKQKVTFQGTTINSTVIEDLPDLTGIGTSDPATLVLNGATWKNSGAVLMSGTLDLLSAASLTTGRLGLDPDQGAAPNVSVAGKSSLTSSGVFSALSLQVSGGGKATAQGDATLVAAGVSSIRGSGSLFSVADTLKLVGTTLSIKNGGKITSNNADVDEGVDIGSGGAKWTIGNALTLGLGGVTVDAGGAFSAAVGKLEYGVLTVSGGTATISGLVEDGQINVTKGGSLTTGLVVQAGGSSDNVSGAGSYWTNHGNFDLGSGQSSGPGLQIVSGGALNNIGKLLMGGSYLSVASGGALTDSGAVIGDDSGSVAGASVGDAGSVWKTTGLLEVGGKGVGALTVTGGGGGATTVSAGTLEIGGGTPSGKTDSVFVTGKGATVTTNGLVAGESGGATASLTIFNGGLVTAGSSSQAVSDLGYGSSTKATLTVAGSGSALRAAGQLDVGFAGSGTMTVVGSGKATVTGELLLGGQKKSAGIVSIMSGGALSDATATLASAADSNARLTISGVDSSWKTTGNLTIGGRGTATLAITGGAKASPALVSDAAAIVGNYSGSSGTVIVSGAGATWKSTNLGIGDDGAASLTVTGDGAGTTALDTSDTKIGFGAAPSGTKARVTVDGKGAVWTNSDQIVLGADAGADDNAVVVEAGGVVRTGILSVGDTDSTELSTVTVTGSGSKLEVSKSLYIGYEGHGRLDVSSKATLSVAQSIVIGGGGATGRGVLSVTGEGCTVTTNELYVGKATSKGETSINNNLTVDGDAIVNVKTTLVLTSGNAINVSFAGTVGAITVGSDVTPVDDCVYVEKDGTLDEMAGSQPTSVGTIYGAVFNDGTIDVESMGDLFIDGGLGGSGVATIETKATLAIDGASFGAITFSGAAGELSLGDAIHYTGKIRGFSDGDKLELEDIAYNAGKTKLTYVPNAGNTGGLLSVADGTHTARLTLIGSYKKSDFKLSADPDGGTRVTDVAGDAPAREAFVYARESEASPHAPAPSAWDAASSAIGLLAAEPGSSSVSPGMFGQA